MESQAFQGILAINPQHSTQTCNTKTKIPRAPATQGSRREGSSGQKIPQGSAKGEPTGSGQKFPTGKAVTKITAGWHMGWRREKKFPAMVFCTKKPTDIASTLGIWPIATVHEGTGSKPI